MTCRPIIFSGPMVRALLAGTKSQTRRILSLRGYRGFTEFGPSNTKGYEWHFRDSEMRWHDFRHEGLLSRLPYAVGDLLWVREACRTFEPVNGRGERVVRYKADANYGLLPEAFGHWSCTPRPSIHMPRWASRITLEVTDVRVQRLQDISEADAIAEGTQEPSLRDILGGACWSERDAHARLWGTLNTKRGDRWADNPWVAAYTFTPHHKNVDALLAEREAA